MERCPPPHPPQVLVHMQLPATPQQHVFHQLVSVTNYHYHHNPTLHWVPALHLHASTVRNPFRDASTGVRSSPYPRRLFGELSRRGADGQWRSLSGGLGRIEELPDDEGTPVRLSSHSLESAPPAPESMVGAIRRDPLRSVETHRQGQVCEAGGLSALQPWAGHPQPASMRPPRFLLLPPPTLSEALVLHPEGQLPATVPVVPGDEDEDMRAAPKRPVTETESPPLVPADPPTQLSQSSSSKRLKKADWPADWTSEYEALKSEPDAALRRSRFSGWCDDLKRHTVHAMSTGPRRDELARWRKEDAAIDRESCSHNWKEGARMGEAKNPGPQRQRARASRPTPTSPTRNRDPGRSNNAITTSANHRGGRAASTASAGEFAMGIRPGPTPLATVSESFAAAPTEEIVPMTPCIQICPATRLYVATNE